MRGASKGEGLGNQFLAHIREVDAIAYVLRCFEDPDVVHVEGRIDPIDDADTIETELMLADLDSLERRVPLLEKKLRGQDKEAKKTLELVERMLPLLREGKPARLAAIADDERAAFKALSLLTSKPVVYVCNVDEASAATGNAYSARVAERAAQGRRGLRGHLGQDRGGARRARRREERQVYLAELGLAEPGLNRLIREGYKLLGLITYFTAGPKEARAWTVPEGTRAPQAAGVIHTDFEKGFIRAETIAYDDYVALGRRGRRARRRQAQARRQGLRRQGRRRAAFQVRDLVHFIRVEPSCPAAVPVRTLVGDVDAGQARP